MRRSRAVGALACLAVAVAVVPAPVAAQSVNRAAIDDLNTQLLYVALPLTLFVELTLVYAIYRFRDNDDPQPTVDDPALEITWTAATAVILLFVGLSAYFVMANPYITPRAAAAPADASTGTGSGDMVVEVDTYQWGWEFTYPGESVTTRDRVAIPVDRDVRFRLESRDVIHSFYVPGLGLKQDVFPGGQQVARTRATRTGSYDLFCAELCGVGHSRMDGTVRVLNESAYDEWVAERAAG
jgi:cytochrome c oxidase subunit 2